MRGRASAIGGLGTPLNDARPFAGLRPFDTEDHDYFFGRTDQVYALFRLLDHDRFLAVIGSSGSGKSSLVRAGLLPLLEEESAGSGGRAWRWTLMRPGDAPLDTLAQHLAGFAPEPDGDDEDEQHDLEILQERIAFALRRSSFGIAAALDEMPELKDQSLLIVVDQFEELFHAASGDRVADAAWRDASMKFVQLLLEVTRDRSRSVYVLITMRSDFIGDCAQFYGLPEAVSAAQYLVPSLTSDQREQVIRGPLEKVGSTIEPALVSALLNDAGTELDQLPVLQHCMQRLWDTTVAIDGKRRLTLQQYAKIGTITGALSEHANAVLASLPGRRRAVEQVFRALSERDKEGRATRRPLPLAKLEAETGVPPAEVVDVVERFRADDCSFLIPSESAEPHLKPETRIDVVHEALLRKWDAISAESDHALVDKTVEDGWLAKEDADGRLYRAMLALVSGGSSSHRVTLPFDQVELRLKWWRSRKRTAAWAERYGGNFQRVEALFTDSADALAKHRADVEEGELRAREAGYQKRRAEEAKKREFRTRVAAFVMACFAAAAIVFAVVAAQNYNLQQAYQRQLVSFMSAQNARNRLEVDLAEQRRRDEQIAARKQRAALQKALDAATAARADAEKARKEAERLGAEADRHRSAAERQRGQAVKQHAAVLLQSGRDAFIRGDPQAAAVLLAAAYREDARNPESRLLLGEALSKLTTTTVPAHRDLVTALAFNPNPRDRRLATGSADGTAKLWDGSGHLVHSFRGNADQVAVTALAFDQGGRYLAITGSDGSARVYDLADVTATSARAPIQLRGHTRRISSVAFSHDRSRIATTSSDGRTKLWSTSSGEGVADWIESSEGVNDGAFTAGDKFYVTASSDGVLRIHDVSGAAKTQSVEILSKSPLLRLAMTQHGNRVAVGAVDGTVLIYDLATKRKIERHDHNRAINALVFDESETRLLSAGQEGKVIVSHGVTGDLLSMTPAAGTYGPGASPAVVAAAFGPDGTIVMATADGTVSSWTKDGRVAAYVRQGGAQTVLLQMSPDGTSLAMGQADGTVSWWRSGDALRRGDATSRGAIDSIAFSPRGQRIVTASRDGTATIWQFGNGLHRQRTLAHGTGSAWVTAARFNHDGTRVLTAGGDAVKIWRVADADGALPIARIAVTLPKQRFSTATFLSARNDVIAGQASTDSLPTTRWSALGGWSVWSSDGKIVAGEPGPLMEIRSVQPTHDGKFVLALGVNGTASFNPTATRTTMRTGYSYEYSTNVTEGTVANRLALYALGYGGGAVALAAAGKLHATVGAHRGRVSALAFSPDDHWLASGGADGTAKIWNVAHYRPRLHATLRGHIGEITSIAFSANGDYVLTTSVDGSAKIWGRDSGDVIGSTSIPSETIRTAAFSPDGSMVALGTAEGRLFGWRIRPVAMSPGTMAREVLHRTGRLPSGANLILRQAYDELRQDARAPATSAEAGG